jgi:hypothetical protein
MNSRNIAALVREFRENAGTAMAKPQDQPTTQDKPKLSPEMWLNLVRRGRVRMSALNARDLAKSAPRPALPAEARAR